MTLTLWTDTYCTVADADLSIALFDNNVWLDKTTNQKESYLKVASKMIDLLVFRGDPAADGQPMQFPRDFDTILQAEDRIYYPDEFYTEDEQEKRLAQAVSEQIRVMISPVQIEDIKGGADDRRYTLSDSATDFIRFYINPVSPLDTGESGVNNLWGNLLQNY
jgi:hypothetical protein